MFLKIECICGTIMHQHEHGMRMSALGQSHYQCPKCHREIEVTEIDEEPFCSICGKTAVELNGEIHNGRCADCERVKR